jgi:hypothetical protein
LAVLTSFTFGYFFLLFFTFVRENPCPVWGIIIENRHKRKQTGFCLLNRQAETGLKHCERMTIKYMRDTGLQRGSHNLLRILGLTAGLSCIRGCAFVLADCCTHGFLSPVGTAEKDLLNNFRPYIECGKVCCADFSKSPSVCLVWCLRPRCHKLPVAPRTLH